MGLFTLKPILDSSTFIMDNQVDEDADKNTRGENTEVSVLGLRTSYVFFILASYKNEKDKNEKEAKVQTVPLQKK